MEVLPPEGAVLVDEPARRRAALAEPLGHLLEVVPEGAAGRKADVYMIGRRLCFFFFCFGTCLVDWCTIYNLLSVWLSRLFGSSKCIP